MTSYRQDDGLGRVLEGLPRAAPPAIPLEQLLDALAARRKRLLAAASGLGLAGLLLALLLLSREPEPPVHLRLRVIDVTEPLLVQEVRPDQPRELDLP